MAETQDDLLDRLIDHWEELRGQGEEPNLADICKDTPDLVPELQKKIQALRAMDDLLREENVTLEFTGRLPGPKEVEEDRPRISGYALEEQVGKGGVGVVYKARHLGLNRIVALKIVRASHFLEESARFRHEAQILAGLENPRIARVYDVGEENGWLYYTLEYLPRGSLAHFLKNSPQPWEPARAAQFMIQVAQGVGLAHANHIIHRDLKPGNILLDDQGNPKIADFGLAKKLDSKNFHTPTLAWFGTPAYMSPEQAAGKSREATGQSDIYSLGVMLYQLLLGKTPFEGNEMSVLQKVVKEAPPRPRLKRPEIPANLENVCLRCLEKDPLQRYPSTEALIEDLQKSLQGETVPEAPMVVHRRRALIFQGIILTACLALVVGLPLWGWSQGFFSLRQSDQEKMAQGVKQAQNLLAQGKPFTFLPEKGPLPWIRWVCNPGGIIDHDPEVGGIQVNSQSYSLLEILPSLPCSSFRITMDVREIHGNPISGVGVYFSLQDIPLGKDRLVNMAHFNFQDTNTLNVQNQENHLYLAISSLWNPESTDLKNTSVMTSDVGPALAFEPNLFKKGLNPWRKLAVEVRPDQITFLWEGKDKLVYNKENFQDGYNRIINNAHFLKGVVPQFDSQAGVGLVVSRCVAGFKNVVLEPLDP